MAKRYKIDYCKVSKIYFTIMNTLDENIFTYCICPYLTGKIIDDILLVNKQYNKVVKADLKHLYNLFWEIKEGRRKYGFKYKEIYKDEKLEGEQLEWYEDGQLASKEFYKDGKQEGKQIRWFENGQLLSKEFYKEGKKEGEQLCWWNNGQLLYTEFYKDGKLEG